MNFIKQLFCKHKFKTLRTGKEVISTPVSYNWYRSVQYKYTDYKECKKCGKKTEESYILQR